MCTLETPPFSLFSFLSLLSPLSQSPIEYICVRWCWGDVQTYHCQWNNKVSYIYRNCYRISRCYSSSYSTYNAPLVRVFTIHNRVQKKKSESDKPKKGMQCTNDCSLCQLAAVYQFAELLRNSMKNPVALPSNAKNLELHPPFSHTQREKREREREKGREWGERERGEREKRERETLAFRSSKVMYQNCCRSCLLLLLLLLLKLLQAVELLL